MNRYTLLQHIATLLGLPDPYQTPVTKLYTLTDAPDYLYVWDVNGDADEIAETLTQSYRNRHGRDPRATHIIVDTLDDISEGDRHHLLKILQDDH